MAKTLNAKEFERFRQSVSAAKDLSVVRRAKNRYAQRQRRRNRELLAAAKGGDVDKVYALIQAGTKVNIRDSRGFQPLILASFYGHHGVVEELLLSDADPNLYAKDGSSALKVAAEGGHYHVVDLLFKMGADLDYGTNGDTPLFMAAQEGHLDVVLLLLYAGSDPHKGEITPLSVAQLEGHEDVVRALQEFAKEKPRTRKRRSFKDKTTVKLPNI